MAGIHETRMRERDGPATRAGQEREGRTPGTTWCSPSPATAPELAAQLGLTLARTYAMARKGLIPAVWLGRQLRFEPRAILNWLATGERISPARSFPRRTKGPPKACGVDSLRSQPRGRSAFSARRPINAHRALAALTDLPRCLTPGALKHPERFLSESRPRISYRSNSPGRSYGRDGTSMMHRCSEHRDAWRVTRERGMLQPGSTPWSPTSRPRAAAEPHPRDGSSLGGKRPDAWTPEQRAVWCLAPSMDHTARGKRTMDHPVALALVGFLWAVPGRSANCRQWRLRIFRRWWER